MSANGERPGRATLDGMLAARRRAAVVSGLRGMGRAAGGGADRGAAAPEVEVEEQDADAERCDLCGITLPGRPPPPAPPRRAPDRVCVRELLDVRSGDPEYRPAGNRTVWLPDLDVPDDLWASFQIPIGLAFFMDSTVTSCVVALYPSPAGATESELHFESWRRMRDLNPVLDGLEPDIEGLDRQPARRPAGVRDRADRPAATR